MFVANNPNGADQFMTPTAKRAELTRRLFTIRGLIEQGSTDIKNLVGA